MITPSNWVKPAFGSYAGSSIGHIPSPTSLKEDFIVKRGSDQRPHDYLVVKAKIKLQLSHIQWMAGFCRFVRNESNTQARNFMLDYVIHLLDNTQDVSWASAKARHTVLLYRIEQGEVSGWLGLVPCTFR